MIFNQNLTEAERKQVAEACRELNTLGSGLVCDQPEREHPSAAVDRAIRAMDARGIIYLTPTRELCTIEEWRIYR